MKRTAENIRRLGLSVLLCAAVGCGDGAREVVDESAQNQIVEHTGNCVHPALDFEDLGRWKATGAGAPSSVPTSGDGKFAISVPAGPHTLVAKISPQSLNLSTSSASVSVAATSSTQGSLTVDLHLADGTPIRRWASGEQNFSGSKTMTLNSQSNSMTTGEGTLLESIVVEVVTNFNQPVVLDRLNLGSLICQHCTLQVPDAPSSRVPANVVEKHFEVLLPEATGLEKTAIAASSGDLWVNDTSIVFDSSGTTTNFGAVAKTAAGGVTNLGWKTQVGRVLARGDLTLRETHVFGDVIYGGKLTVQQPGTTIDGSIVQQNVKLVPALQGRFYFPKLDTAPDVVRNADAPLLELAPGNYGSLRVGARATVRLQPGSYTFRSIILETDSVLDLPNHAKGHRIYVRDQMILRGKSGPSQDVNKGNVLFVFDGTGAVPLTFRLFGTFVAPNAPLDLATTNSTLVSYRGAFYAKSVVFHQNSKLRHVPYAGGDCEADVVHQCGTSKPGCPVLTGCENECSFADFGTAGLPEICYAMGGETPDEPVWGVADLHAHPATHLGFGAKVEGGELIEPGLFHGTPTDEAFAACSPDTHSGFDLDFVRHETRQTVIGMIDQKAGHIHTPFGGDTMSSWPSARSVVHQQMHVDWVRRAHKGGLRLMFASVADNQLLSQLWNNGFNALGNSVKPGPGWNEKEQARQQLQYIIDLAAANSDFMRVVRTPKEAREAIRDDKLAIVLSLEMDRLKNWEIFQLRNEFGVAHVIPIHLVDNDFGGTAIYDSLFEASNHFLNDRPFKTEASDRLSYRLAEREVQVLGQEAAGALIPKELDIAEFPGFKRPVCGASDEATGRAAYGQRNELGLTTSGDLDVRDLLRAGVMVDVAHMSEKAADSTIEIAEATGVPVMSSHGGLREGSVVTEELAERGVFRERELTFEQARRISALGGVLGIGTAGGLDARKLFRFQGGDAVRFGRPNGHDDNLRFSWGLVDRKLFPVGTLVHSLRLRVATGSDDKRSDASFDAWVKLRDGRKLTWSIASGEKFDDHTRQAPIDLALEAPLGLHDVVSAGLTRTGGGNDTWKATELAMDWSDEHGATYPLFEHRASVTEEHDGYFFRFSETAPSWSETIEWPEDISGDPLVEFVQVKLVTGDDDLGGQGAKLGVEFGGPCRKSGELSFADIPGGGHERVFELNLPGPVRASQIRRVFVSHDSVCKDPPVTPDILALGGFLGSPATGVFGLGGQSVVASDIALAAFFIKKAIEGDGCIFQDNWDIDVAEVSGLDSDGKLVRHFSSHRGHPWTRLTGNRTAGLLYEREGACERPKLDDPAELIEVALTTGKDDLRPESSPLVSIYSATGSLLGSTALNPKAPWTTTDTRSFLRTNSVVRAIVALPPGTRVRDLGEFRIDAGLGPNVPGVLDHDDWDVDSITVTVVADPVAKFNETYRFISGVMGGHGVALGTDINGLQDQIPAAVSRLGDWFSVASPRGPSARTSLDRATAPGASSAAEFDFGDSGLAHYGMLPDFLATLRKVPNGGADSADRLFRSAEDVIRMWEKVERMSKVNVPPSPPPSTEPCSPATLAQGGNTGNFGTTGAVCYKVATAIAGWGCSNFAGRTLLVNDVTVSCGGALPAAVNNSYYFEVSAGTNDYASIYWW